MVARMTTFLFCGQNVFDQFENLNLNGQFEGNKMNFNILLK